MNYSSTALVVSDDPKLPDSLNEFYCRFDKDRDDALIQPTGIKTRATPSVLQELQALPRILQYHQTLC